MLTIEEESHDGHSKFYEKTMRRKQQQPKNCLKRFKHLKYHQFFLITFKKWVLLKPKYMDQQLLWLKPFRQQCQLYFLLIMSNNVRMHDGMARKSCLCMHGYLIPRFLIKPNSFVVKYFLILFEGGGYLHNVF